MTSNTPQQDLAPLDNAITSLDRLQRRVADEPFMAAQDEIIRLGLQAGLIQNLEFTYELCWKAIKRWMQNNVNPEAGEGVTRRELFRLAAENRLIEDVEEWMIYHEARNRTSHRYGSLWAENAVSVIADFTRAAQRLLANLKTRND